MDALTAQAMTEAAYALLSPAEKIRAINYGYAESSQERFERQRAESLAAYRASAAATPWPDALDGRNADATDGVRPGRRSAPVRKPEIAPYVEDGPCQICGEPRDDEMGEFWDDRTDDSFVAHAQCGLDYDFELA